MDGGGKLKILMLHGYRQNEIMFRDKTGGLRKALKNYAELTYCEAPHFVPIDESNPEEVATVSSPEKVMKGWFIKKIEAPDRDTLKDMNDSLDHVNRVFETKGPFDGIWGFSQGATLATCLARVVADNPERLKHARFKFLVLAATCKSSDPAHDVFYNLDKKIDVPSLHISGKTDKLVQYDRAIAHLDYFHEPEAFIHELGHLIPVNAESKQIFTKFLDKMKEIS